MTITDEDVLEWFRGNASCEHCGGRGQLVPHHIRARGMGGGSRIDHPFNLVALCALCHAKAHAPKDPIPPDAFEAIVARREGVQVSEAKAFLRWVARQPKDRPI